MLPVQRKTRTQTRKGRSHHALDAAVSVSCPHSGEARRPHTACRETGYVAPNGNRPGFFLDIKLLRRKNK
ncbi:MAG: 50S ribosomal protein L32 [Planctomycetota bacterium]